MNIAVKRMLAYLIDMALIFIIVSLIKLALPINQYEIELNNLNEKYLEQKINIDDYFNESIILAHNIDKNKF